MNNNFNETIKFDSVKEEKLSPRQIILSVFDALNDKGYNPINQIVGYILSGDPSYITAHNDARKLILKLERDEILEELVRFYVKD